MIKSSNKYMILLSFFILLIAAVIISLFTGKYAVSLNDGFLWLKAFLGGNVYDDKISNISTILFQIRLPRILGAVIIGAALGVSGAMLQSVFANPLVSPGIMGVLSGASFGAAFGIITFSVLLIHKIPIITANTRTIFFIIKASLS